MTLDNSEKNAVVEAIHYVIDGLQSDADYDFAPHTYFADQDQIDSLEAEFLSKLDNLVSAYRKLSGKDFGSVDDQRNGIREAADRARARNAA